MGNKGTSGFIRSSLVARAATSARRLASAAKKAHVPEAEIERWSYLMDPSRCSVQEFIEAYRVNTKEIQADGTNQCAIQLWPAQLRILEAVIDEWERGRAAKLVILKDREQGCSFVIQALMWERFLRGGGGEMRTVSHKDSATEALQMDFQSFIDQTPEWVFQSVLEAEWDREAIGVWKLLWPNKSFSFAETMTCRDGAMGRGNRTRWFHLSEYPWWTTGRANVAGALTVLRDTPGNIYIFESTGKEFDEFYDLCEGARRGATKDEPRGENGWRLMFFSWLDHPLKEVGFRGPAERAAFAETVGKLPRYDEREELAIFEATGGNLERLNWRRKQIDAPGVNGDVAWFQRDHPRVFEQAFYADSDSFFDPQILDSRRLAAEAEQLRAERGTMTWEVTRNDLVVKFEPSNRGALFVYKRPQKGRRYCFGCDPASGKKVTDQGRKTADYATILVLDIETEDVVAIYRDHIPPEDLTQFVFALSRWYGWAPGYIERNADGKTAMYVAEELMRTWPVEADILLPQMRKVRTRSGETWENEPGFLSDPVTKPVACNRLRRWVREMGMYPGSGPSRIPIPLLQEMRLFVRTQTVGKNGMPTGRFSLGASAGHDDVISAAWMAFTAREWLKENPDKQTEVSEATRETSVEWDVMRRQMEAEMGLIPRSVLPLPKGVPQSRQRTEDDAEVPGMPGY